MIWKGGGCRWKGVFPTVLLWDLTRWALNKKRLASRSNPERTLDVLCSYKADLRLFDSRLNMKSRGNLLDRRKMSHWVSNTRNTTLNRQDKHSYTRGFAVQPSRLTLDGQMLCVRQPMPWPPPDEAAKRPTSGCRPVALLRGMVFHVSNIFIIVPSKDLHPLPSTMGLPDLKFNPASWLPHFFSISPNLSLFSPGHCQF